MPSSIETLLLGAGPWIRAALHREFIVQLPPAGLLSFVQLSAGMDGGGGGSVDTKGH